MKAKIANRAVCNQKIGMWSTIADAVQAGWGATGRLLTIILLLGMIATTIAVATGGGDLVVAVRTWISGLP